MKRVLIALSLLLLVVPGARGELFIYKVPNTSLTMTLRGNLKYNAGGTVFYTHEKFGRIVIDPSDIIERHKLPSNEQVFRQMLARARDAQAAMDAANFALKKGMVNRCYEAAEKALEFDAGHNDAQSILTLRKKMDIDLGDSAKEENMLKKTVRLPSMRVSKSKHFILLHDTPDDRPKVNDKTLPQSRSEQRLELLEKVYESFLLKFYSKGVQLEIPQERLMVVLFHDQQDYLSFATSISPDLSSAIGFWDPKSNIAFFFDHGSSKQFEPVRKLAVEVRKQADDAVRRRSSTAKNLVHMANALTLLVAIDQENADIEVVSHECTHQMAGNTGLFPRHIMTPQWIHEGLATYFESPSDATWSGIGAVNESRLKMYKALAQADREHSNVDFIVGDQIFKYAGSHSSILHGYAQAWALTHFLIERHFDEFMAFYRRLGEMPPDIILSPTVLTQLFDEMFETDRKTLNTEWHNYMRKLKTDLEIVRSGGRQGGFR